MSVSGSANNASLSFGGSSGSNQSNGMFVDETLAIAATGTNTIDSGTTTKTASATNSHVIRSCELVAEGTPATTYPGVNQIENRYPYSTPTLPLRENHFTDNLIYNTDSSKVSYVNAVQLTYAQFAAQAGSSGNSYEGAPVNITRSAAGKAWTFDATAHTLTGV